VNRSRIIAIGSTLLLIACSSSDEGQLFTPTGRLRVTTATTGADLDPDGYTLLVNGVGMGSIGVNTALTVSGLEPGTVTLDLADVAPNCTTLPATPQSLSIVEDQTTQAAYAVSCSATTGVLRLLLNSTGYFPDIDTILSYQIDVQAAHYLKPGFDSTFTLPVGQHTVAIGQVASHCSDPNGTVRGVVIVSGDTTAVQFDFTCTAITGSLWVWVEMIGAAPDLDGYFIARDGLPPGHLGDSLSGVGYLNLTPGLHTVTLTGVAPNCMLDGPSTRQYTVVAGMEIQDTMHLNCP